MQTKLFLRSQLINRAGWQTETKLFTLFRTKRSKSMPWISVHLRMGHIYKGVSGLGWGFIFFLKMNTCEEMPNTVCFFQFTNFLCTGVVLILTTKENKLRSIWRISLSKGSLNKYDNDDDNFKITTLHVSKFRWRRLHDYDVKPPNLPFYGGRGHDDEFSFLFLNLNKILTNSTPVKIVCVWHIERVQ